MVDDGAVFGVVDDLHGDKLGAEGQNVELGTCGRVLRHHLWDGLAFHAPAGELEYGHAIFLCLSGCGENFFIRILNCIMLKWLISNICIFTPSNLSQILNVLNMFFNHIITFLRHEADVSLLGLPVQVTSDFKVLLKTKSSVEGLLYTCLTTFNLKLPCVLSTLKMQCFILNLITLLNLVCTVV